MKHLKKFNEDLNFEKGYSRVSYQSEEMEHYWNGSQNINRYDLNRIKEWMSENGIDCEVSLKGRSIYVRMKSTFKRIIDLGLDEYNHLFHGGDVSKRMVDVSGLLIWEGAPRYDPDNRGYFNITVYDVQRPRFLSSPKAYFTTDSIYGLMDFFEDFFKGKRAM